jgi:hypothetical protein
VLASVGNWQFIDSEGFVSSIESFELVSGTTYRFEIIRATPPALGVAHIYYACPIVIDCDYCRASALLVRISPTTIVSFPEALEGDALGRLIIRLTQMIPAHVRITAFIFDPGPAQASWGPITATTLIEEASEEDALYSAYFDEDEFPADEIPLDSSPIVASSEVTITNQNVFEEYIDGSDPLISGAWTATGLWQITEYRSSTQFRAFDWGQNDVGRLGEGGAVAPDYDTGAISAGILTSPSIGAIAAATTVNLRIKHFGQVRAGAGDDDTFIEVIEDTFSGVVQTITKADLGLSASGTNGGYTTFIVDIGPGVIAAGPFHLEFNFDSITSTTGVTGEGWYVDDVEVQLIP